MGEVARTRTEKSDASSDQAARSGGRMLVVGILRVEEERGTETVDGNGRLKGRRSRWVCCDRVVFLNPRKHFYCLSV